MKLTIIIFLYPSLTDYDKLLINYYYSYNNYVNFTKKNVI